ncbi:MAG: hypothetical protein JW395_2323 [Nitrospira sp.]|nr:hypothetical protein [Nitrospira sp.]
MTEKERRPGDFLPLSQTNWYVLVSLLSGPKHGYAILREVEALSEGTVRLAVGNLYVALRTLTETGLIERVGDRSADEDERRKYYQIGGFGAEVVSAERQRLQRMQSAFDRAFAFR